MEPTSSRTNRNDREIWSFCLCLYPFEGLLSWRSSTRQMITFFLSFFLSFCEFKGQCQAPWGGSRAANESSRSRVKFELEFELKILSSLAREPARELEYIYIFFIFIFI